MSEPKVGMKFCTFETLTKKAEKETKKAGTDDYVNAQVEGDPIDITIYYRKGAGDAIVSFARSKRFQEGRCDIGQFDYDGLRYEGSVLGRFNNNEPKSDIKFTKMYGNKTYAVDINGNGKVDKGEIFDLDIKA